MHQTSAVMASTIVSPVADPSMTDAPYYPSTVLTPPPSVSPIDLPPIPKLSSHGHHSNGNPPSPTSPKKQKGALPAYLEPSPRGYEFNATSKIRPQLFHLVAPPLISFSTRRATAPTLTHSHQQQSSAISSSLPRRSHSQSMDSIRPHIVAPTSGGYPGMMMTTQYLSTSPNSSATFSPTTVHQQHISTNKSHQKRQNISKKRKLYNDMPPSVSSSELITTTSSSSSPFQGQDPCNSPTLAAACASAAKLHTSMSSSSSSTSSPTHSDDDKKQGVDQSMFLTKNAHIKRPRNAWIHFRCHYGQALKSQDPTLRAEEISKRASRRWSMLSENEKRPWHQLAEQEKQAHKEAFPEYRYCPKRATTVTATINQPTSPVTYTNATHSPTSPTSQHGSFRLPRLLSDQELK
ncbi:hypothetical protein BCR42DRAFT_453823 [Absidia repens]|uniref:HMG box domain-containing protein n=1 Tax=Absidia repens TaxID=90262 RepID=A0A1X2I8W3_9FUNG|nr:hypothetical protein BCR42DRAFT_453823 [Absidia repens]